MPAKRRDQLGVLLIGAGAFGTRRAQAVLSNPRSALVAVADPVLERARAVAEPIGACPLADWRDALDRKDVDVSIVATSTAVAPEISLAMLEAGKHVLVEKPFGRHADEVLPALDAARQQERLLKVGYNHRYHPALAKAYELYRAGVVGRLLYLGCTYGHGGRPGYEQEWRSRQEISGGGELLDQGVHALDLFRWFAGEFCEAAAFIATSYWPIAPVEDNVFAMLLSREGVIAQLHASWTRWKNKFSFEVAGEHGSLIAEGLGRSYGPERLILQARCKTGGAPEEKFFDFPTEDDSLAREWNDFLDTIQKLREPMSSGEDAWRTLQLVDALYESAREHRIVQLRPTAESRTAARAAGVMIS
jgi:predicted dehydrogenase